MKTNCTDTEVRELVNDAVHLILAEGEKCDIGQTYIGKDVKMTYSPE